MNAVVTAQSMDFHLKTGIGRVIREDGRKACYNAGQEADSLDVGIMPVIDRIGPFRILFYLREIKKPHVHVQRDDIGAKIWLNPVGVARNESMNARELNKVLLIVKENRERYLEAWNEQFGDK